VEEVSRRSWGCKRETAHTLLAMCCGEVEPRMA